MAGDFAELDEWVKGLESLERELRGGGELFQRHAGRYLELAKTVAGQTLLGLMPEGQDPLDWRDRVHDFVELVFSRVGEDSLEIVYAGRSAEDRGGKQVSVTYDDVLKWVQAGVEHGGKDKTAVENNRNRADEQIAYDVHQAIKQHHMGGVSKKDYSGITARLERWVEERVLAGDFSELLMAVLDAWSAALEPVLWADFDQWLDECVERM